LNTQRKYKFLSNFFIIINLLLILDIIYLIFININFISFSKILTFVCSVLIIQNLLITLYFKIFKKYKLFLYSFFIALNLCIFKFLSYSQFANSRESTKFIFFIFTVNIIFICFNFLKKKNAVKFCLIVIIINLTSIFSFHLTLKKNSASVTKVVNFEFKKKPNIYLIGLDGLQTDKNINKFLHTNLEFTKDVKKNYLFYRNSFAPKNPTWKSWVNILSLADKKDKASYQSFRGADNSSNLINIFKSNGYKIFTGFTSASQGFSTGKFIDEFSIYSSTIKKSALCWRNHTFLNIPKFYGICRNFFTKILYDYEKLSESDYIINKLQNYNNSSPFIFLYHSTSMTIHRSNKNKFSKKNKEDLKFKKKYVKGFNEINLFLLKLSNYIKNNDPYGIVFLFGDHGIYTMGKINKKDFIMFNKDFILDRSAIALMSLKSKNECIPSKDASLLKSYSTTPRAILHVINCLKKNKHEDIKSNSLDENLELFNFGGGYLIYNDDIMIKNYLYE